LIRTDGVELKADLSTFSTGSGLTVISVKAKENGNTLEVTYRNINTGEITKEDVLLKEILRILRISLIILIIRLMLVRLRVLN